MMTVVRGYQYFRGIGTVEQVRINIIEFINIIEKREI